MKVGLQIPAFKWDGGAATIAPRLKKIARTADGAGFASLWVMDHFYQLEGMIGPADDPMLEGYSTLAFLAAATERVQLGTLVTGVIYRHPAVLVKTATTLDVLSGGRAYLGIGAAWYEKEARGLGIPFPPLKKRFEKLEETLQIAHHMWNGNREPFKGRDFQMDEPISSPQPLAKPHPPILIGGSGEKKTLRMVAQYADACNLMVYGGTEQIAHKLDVLKRHCDNLGRNYDDIERTALGTVHIAPGQMSPADVIALCRSVADVGIQHIILNMPNTHDITPLEVFGREMIPEVAGF